MLLNRGLKLFFLYSCCYYTPYSHYKVKPLGPKMQQGHNTRMKRFQLLGLFGLPCFGFSQYLADQLALAFQRMRIGQL